MYVHLENRLPDEGYAKWLKATDLAQVPGCGYGNPVPTARHFAGCHGLDEQPLASFLHQWRILGQPLDDDLGDMRTKDDAGFKLNQLVSGKGFGYEYDFGDSWEHELIVEKILPAEEGVY